MGLCLGLDVDQRCCEGEVEFYRNDLTKTKMMLKLQSRTPSLLQDCTSLHRGFRLTAESGLKSA